MATTPSAPARRQVLPFAIEQKNLHRAVVDELGSKIVSGQLNPGDVLVEGEIGTQLGVSRNGVREAVKVLTAKGMLRSRTKVGTIVQPRSDWNMLDPDVLIWWSRSDDKVGFTRAVHEVRLQIEPGAAAWAAERGSKASHARIAKALEGMFASSTDSEAWVARDLEFHLAILEATGNPLLNSLGHLIGAGLTATFEMTVRMSMENADALPNHAAVCEAILARNPEAARAAMLHVLGYAGSALEAVRKHERKSQSRRPKRRSSR